MRRGDLVFDVGANVGNRVEAFASLHARVAIEPQPECAQLLRETFGSKCVVVEKGLGPAQGKAELHRATQDVLATMSGRWIEATQASGRFEESWDESITIEVTTLDELIAQRGMPRFTKIDVEGYEPEVLAGVSRALPAVSFEYAHEVADSAAACIARLDSLASYEYAYSACESMELRSWMTSDAILPAIARDATEALEWGNIYARLISGR